MFDCIIHCFFGISIFFTLFSYNLSLDHDQVPCTPVGDCSCEFPDGQGINLTLLRGFSLNVSLGQNAEFLFYPCNNTQVVGENGTTINECGDGVSLCLKEHDVKLNATHYYNLGTLTEGSFLWERIIDDPILIFTHKNKTTEINLECNKESIIPSLVYVSPSSTKADYVFKLTTDLACVSSVAEEGRSVFASFAIIVLTLFLFYFFIGFLVLRFIRGAQGWEAIPNGEFWKSVISSIKWTFVFFVNGCKHPETYDTI